MTEHYDRHDRHLHAHPGPDDWEDFDERLMSKIIEDFWRVCGEAYPEEIFVDQWWSFGFSCECPLRVYSRADSRGQGDLYNAAENALKMFRRAHEEHA